jgi:prevent-host-death family protein
VFVPTSNDKGGIAETAIALEAMRHGVVVFRPMTEGTRYDLVFAVGARLIRVQCKWGRVRGDVIQVQIGGSYHSPTRGYVRSTYGPDEIDVVAVYCGELDQCYLLPIEIVAGLHAIQLRLAPAKNAQRAGLHWATEYQLSGAVAQLGERRHGMAEARGSSPLSSTPSPTNRRVGAHEFRNHFGFYMELAAAGSEIAVTRRGKPYVRLVPADAVTARPAQQSLTPPSPTETTTPVGPRRGA